ncbi:MAG: small conductance mechanosensitive channel [Thermoleophilaceae bacterium]|jgi:small-conductance mechanosensitive channel|nr:small conductance mechanosensitive channel [Thermoleophilaceae bacterium]
MPIRKRPEIPMRDMFETRTHAWREAGLELELEQKAATRARWEALVFLPLLIGVIVAYNHRQDLFPGAGDVVKILTVVVLVIVGWIFARAVGRALGPALFRRLDPGTAGTVGFLIRLLTVTLALLIALRIAGIEARTLAIGGAVTAVVFGLAAQQTLGNLIAGTVLLSARPFRVGDRVRLQGGPIGGELEGIVSSLGLLYTSLVSGADRILVPNSVVISIAIIPIREPSSVDLRARFPADLRPSAVQEILERGIDVPTRRRPDIEVQEMDGDEMVVRISATPERPADGAKLADQMLAAIASVSANGGPDGSAD